MNWFPWAIDHSGAIVALIAAGLSVVTWWDSGRRARRELQQRQAEAETDAELKRQDQKERAKIEGAVAVIDGYSKFCNDLQEQLQASNKDISDCRVEIQTLKDEIVRLHALHDQAQREHVAERLLLEDRIRELERERAELKTRLESLERENKQLRQQLVSLQNTDVSPSS